MIKDKRTRPSSTPLLLLVPFILMGALMVSGCDSNENAPANLIEGIAITPDTASIGIGEQMEFTVVGLTASGDTVRDADFTLTWWSTDPSVFTVEGGTATGQQAGTAFCKVEADDNTRNTASQTRSRRFVGRDSAFVFVP